MTITEAGEIIDILFATYPRHYANMNLDQKAAMIKVWSKIFADEEKTMVEMAVVAYLSGDVRGFPPVPGQIKEKIVDLKCPNEMTELEAWNLVKKAVQNTDRFCPQKAYETLPILLQRLLGSPTVLVEYGLQDDKTFSVTGAAFMRSYRARLASEKEYAALPADVKRVMDQIAEARKFPDHLQLDDAGWNRMRNEKIHMLESMEGKV